MTKETIFKIITIIIGVFLSLLIAEIASRVYLFGSAAFSYNRMNSLVQLKQTNLAQGAENNHVLYELKPNYDGLFRGVNVKTNSFGHRDREYAISKPKNVVRGVFIGDSYTMGASVEIEDVFHTQMEDILNGNTSGIDYEFINFGVWGYNLLNYWGVLQTKVLPFNPDFIVIGFCATNDAELPKPKHYRGTVRFNRPIVKDPLFTSYLKKLYDRARGFKGIPQPITLEQSQKDFVGEMFLNNKSFSEENNIPIIISYLSIEESKKYLEDIKEIALDKGLRFLDFSDKFKNEDINAHRINVLDNHPNDRANEIFAQTLLDYKPLLEIIEERKKVILSQ